MKLVTIAMFCALVMPAHAAEGALEMRKRFCPLLFLHRETR